MREVAIKTHLIITNIYDEYHMSWQGKIINTKPKFKDDKLMFLLLENNLNIPIQDFIYRINVFSSMTLKKISLDTQQI